MMKRLDIYDKIELGVFFILWILVIVVACFYPVFSDVGTIVSIGFGVYMALLFS